ncbi:MAG: hypothetical protein ACK4TP_11240 [Hyphomicrobium sp.]
MAKLPTELEKQLTALAEGLADQKTEAMAAAFSTALAQFIGMMIKGGAVERSQAIAHLAVLETLAADQTRRGSLKGTYLAQIALELRHALEEPTKPS